ncbi:unnamed protein product, partial [Oppiella nova]
RLSVNVKPFKGLVIDRRVDAAIDEILELTLNRFVNQYLEDFAINTNKLDHELRHILRTLLSALIRRAMDVNITDFLLEQLPKVLTHHLETYVAGKRHSKTAQYVEESVLREYGHLIHPAMNGREEEIKYLTSVVERVLPHILPPKYMNCKLVDCFFKQLMACSVLLPLMDISGDPDKINALLVVLLDENTLSVNENRNNSENMVEILDTFVANKGSHTRDSNGLKMGNNEELKYQDNNMMAVSLRHLLSDHQLLFLFQQFSKDE